MKEAPLEVATPFRHWRHRRNDHDVEWLTLDMADSHVNVLTADVLRELLYLLEKAANARPRGLILRSGKETGFTVGADISEFKDMTDLPEVEAKVRRAHAIADLLEKFPAPTAIVAHGTCVGGGLELALCCDCRIALPDVQLGFPEVFLGLHPGMGGTFRSLRLIDPMDAMTLMLTGKNKTAQQALDAGLVDAVVEENRISEAVHAALSDPFRRKRKRIKSAAFKFAPLRRLAAGKMRSKTRQKVRPDHYPAPFALIDLWETHGGNLPAMQRAEIASFSKLLIGQTAQNLVRLFFLRKKMKRLGLDVHPVHNASPSSEDRAITEFLVAQALKPYLSEAKKMINEGIPAETINKAARDFGMTAAPIPQGSSNPKTPHPKPDLTDRLILPLVNASIRLLREGPTNDPDIIDGALVFGGGFPPFRGGPLRYAGQRGIAETRETLSRLAEQHGKHFQPDEAWELFNG